MVATFYSRLDKGQSLANIKDALTVAKKKQKTKRTSQECNSVTVILSCNCNDRYTSFHIIRPTNAGMWNVFLSHVTHYRYISILVAVIIRIIYKITRSPNKLLKCITYVYSRRLFIAMLFIILVQGAH